MTTSTAYYTNAQHATATCTSSDDQAYESGYQAGFNGSEYVRPFSNSDRTFYRVAYKKGQADKQAGVYADSQDSAIEKLKNDLTSIGVTAVVKVKADFIHNIYTVYNGRSIVAKGQLADVQLKVSVYVSTTRSMKADRN